MPQAPHRHIQRVSRGLLAVARGRRKSHEHLRNRLLAILWVTILVDAFATVAVYFAERHGSGTDIHNLWDAFLFATSQLFTASSVASPSTETGKVLELVFDIYAITVVATLAGSFGAFFNHQRVENERELAAMQETGPAAPGDVRTST